MSTKAIAEALKLADAYDVDVDAALAELEAIRKAARAIDDALPAQAFAVRSAGFMEALALLEAIAKEGTHGR